jgi:hypothetical protein
MELLEINSSSYPINLLAIMSKIGLKKRSETVRAQKILLPNPKSGLRCHQQNIKYISMFIRACNCPYSKPT